MKKGLILIIAVMTVVCISISATLAYLFVETDPVENTFEYGDINITLDESKNLNLKMIPGSNITKDPKVTVLKDSEACWLFVEINKSANFDNFMSYEIADGWTQGNGTDIPANVYYREVPATEADTKFEVLKGNLVSVKDTVTKDMFNALTDGTKPTLTFKAYAVQKENVNSAADAWKLVGTKGLPVNP